MPRNKAPPTKRARVADPPPALDEASLQRAADDALVQTWSGRIASGDVTTFNASWTSSAIVSAEVPNSYVIGQTESIDGLRLLALPRADVAVFQSLHRTIREKLHGSLTGWGGREDTSGRERGYGYLPGSELAARHRAASHSMKEYSGAQATADADANRAASVMLDVADLPSDFSGALDRLLEALRASLPAKFAPVLQPDQLVAAQPNVHGGLRFLPPHLDEPLHDGFGVVIVTVAVAGGGRILLQSRPFDAARRRDYSFQMAEGGAYVLSGDARNTCLHGVLADAGARESLNLRFGLHSAERGAPFSAWDEIEQHWPEAAAAADAPPAEAEEKAAAAAAAIVALPARMQLKKQASAEAAAADEKAAAAEEVLGALPARFALKRAASEAATAALAPAAAAAPSGEIHFTEEEHAAAMAKTEEMFGGGKLEALLKGLPHRGPQ